MRLFLLILILWSFSSLRASTSWKSYPYQDPQSSIRFPIDEGRHTMIPNLEWWYTVIHAKGKSSGEEYSILVTHFNNMFRFFTVTNIDRKQHISGTTLGKLSSGQGHLDLKHVTKYGTDIFRTKKNEKGELIPFEYELKTHHAQMKLDVSLSSQKKPLMVGGDGYMPVGSSGHTWYYSLTKLEVNGTLEFDGRTELITGSAWMDHQWGPFMVSPITIGKTFESYEWFCLQLDDGSEIMISNVYDRNNNLPRTEAYGHVERIIQNGEAFHTVNREFLRTNYWQDPVSGHYMSMGWKLVVPEWNLNLTLMPTFYDQMVKFPFNGDFWEGSLLIDGEIAGKKVHGKGFGELVHRFQVPKVKLTKAKKNLKEKILELEWSLKNPDAGNPLTYRVEVLSTKGPRVLANKIKETKIDLVLTDLEILDHHLQVKLTANSIDGVIKGESTTKITE